jgi:hypothetical protein
MGWLWSTPVEKLIVFSLAWIMFGEHKLLDIFCHGGIYNSS